MNDLSAPSCLRVDTSLIAVLFVLNLLLRVLLVAPSSFDGLYGQDPYAYYDFAGELRADLNTGHAPSAFFWPLGYPALLAATFTVFGQQATTGQALNILLGATLAPLVYILARQLSLGHVGALAAGLLMTVCGQALQSSLVLMSDIPALFWALVSAAALWRYFSRFKLNQASTGWLILAAVTLALASITRWIYLILALPWAAVLLLHWKWQMRWRAGLIALAGAIIVLLPQLLYSRTNPAPTLNHAWVEGWSPGNFFQREFTNIDGHFEYEKLNVVYYAQPFYDPYYLAPVFAPFLLIGLWRLFKRGWAHLLFIGGWALLPYLFLAGIPYQNIRFPLIVFPAVAVLAGVGLETMIVWAKTISPDHRQHWIRAAQIMVTLLLIVGLAQSFSVSQNTVTTFITNQQNDKNAAAWAGERVPEGATLYTFGLTLTLKHYTTLNVYELYYETTDTLDRKWIPGQDDYLLINVWNIEHQWAGRDPQLDYHWLRDQRGLTKLGTYGNYTLYRIRG